jgi:hypothetical protein
MLQGKIVALYHNDKVLSFPILKTVRDLLKERQVGVKEIFEVHSRAPFSRHPDSAIAEALKADVVFVANADWGSCTAWVVDAAVRIEKGGKPIILTVNPAFRAEVASHTQMDGIPYLPFVVIDVGQEAIPLVPQAVEKSFDKLIKGLTTPAEVLEKNIPGEVN